MLVINDKVAIDEYNKETDCAVLDSIATSYGNLLGKPSKKVRIIVTIPAKDEEQNIAHCLNSLAGQYASVHTKLENDLYEVLVVCHNCIDNTALVCEQFKRAHPEFRMEYIRINHSAVNNVGAVRRILMHIAATRLSHENGYIATTDADTLSDRFWIANLLGYVNSKYGLICGRIDIDFNSVPNRARAILEQKQYYFHLRAKLDHLLHPKASDPWPRHAHKSGPNLAVRKNVYGAIGGILPKGFREDIALYQSVRSAGFKVRHCPDTIVSTSGRQTSKTPEGFGSEIKLWNGSKRISYKVEGLDSILAKSRVFKAIHRYYRNPTKQAMAFAMETIENHTEILLPYFLKFKSAPPLIIELENELEQIPFWKNKYPLQEISEAIAEIESYVGTNSKLFSKFED
ncbi:glycosyltransferase family 2 protein [Zobellia galactanivorans]|uniref:glycosyltransferase n=1 Tax=Zobellia galactanivorans (strain DSM 12802 / CCUG 47099 / CIP 106680 / NCIMB 13871 / Dsij) TaxID=63186 RepID=UPI001C06E352|nr:glycosyltransferase family 2 protein [Zobellia galactanivorans]MBU3025219.1 glycosyltransferase family 2 protein [Zobellia galactanivorans]MDO6810947.1 glycosyltransferase family 2 protein [Zobellia galactanivorans]